MKKTVYTLSIGNYAPEITKLTFPLMKMWAKKIGAAFHVITDRKFPEFPIPYEKFQISKLSKEHGNDWNYFWDADALIHPDMWDPTEVVGKEVTVSNGSDFVPMRFKPDKYFRRDGRFIGKGNWCMIGSDWVAEDLWSPLHDLTADEAANKITPLLSETSTVIEPYHLIDDYTVSRNISRYSLKHILIPTLKEQLKISTHQPSLLWHLYTIDIDKKAFLMKKQIMLWIVDALMSGEAFVSEIPNDNPVVVTKGIISKLEYSKSKSMDWQEFLAVIPVGNKIAEVIKLWGIEFELKKHSDLSHAIKKELVIGALGNIPNCQEKSLAVNAIGKWDEKVSWEDFLGALDLGVNLAAIIKEKFGVELKVVPKQQVQIKEATKHAPLV